MHGPVLCLVLVGELCIAGSTRPTLEHGGIVKTLAQPNSLSESISSHFSDDYLERNAALSGSTSGLDIHHRSISRARDEVLRSLHGGSLLALAHTSGTREHPHKCVWKKKMGIGEKHTWGKDDNPDANFTCGPNIHWFSQHKVFQELPDNHALKAIVEKIKVCTAITDVEQCKTEANASCAWQDTEFCNINAAAQDTVGDLFLNIQSRIADIADEKTCGSMFGTNAVIEEKETICMDMMQKNKICQSAENACRFEDIFSPNCTKVRKCHTTTRKNPCGAGVLEMGAETEEEKCNKTFQGGHELKTQEDVKAMNSHMTQCLRENNCAAAAQRIQDVIDGNQHCRGINDNSTCEKDEKCKWEETSESKINGTCTLDGGWTFMSLVPDTCALKPMFDLQKKCKVLDKNRCKGDCEWSQTDMCEIGPPNNATKISACTARPAKILHVIAKFAKDAELTALALLMEGAESCNHFKTEEACDAKAGSVRSATPLMTLVSAALVGLCLLLFQVA